jgi:hypothetical protein
MSYPYTDHRWHSAYQAVCKRRDNESLRYVIKDCRDAIRANPENPKCEQYWDEIHYCGMELHKRQKEAA